MVSLRTQDQKAVSFSCGKIIIPIAWVQPQAFLFSLARDNVVQNHYCSSKVENFQLKIPKDALNVRGYSPGSANGSGSVIQGVDKNMPLDILTLVSTDSPEEKKESTMSLNNKGGLFSNVVKLGVGFGIAVGMVWLRQAIQTNLSVFEFMGVGLVFLVAGGLVVEIVRNF